MSINTYDEQKFWEEVDILFPDIVKAITSLAKKSYISITNLRNGVPWSGARISMFQAPMR